MVFCGEGNMDVKLDEFDWGPYNSVDELVGLVNLSLKFPKCLINPAVCWLSMRK